MPFRLKNVETTYQRLVNSVFKDLIKKNMKVYVDDTLVKSLVDEDHVQHLEDTFRVLNRHQMKFNLSKCAFEVASGKFLGFMVTHRGIKANPEMIRALLEMKSPKTIHDVQVIEQKYCILLLV